MDIGVYTRCSLLITALVIPEEGMVGCLLACLKPDQPTKDFDFSPPLDLGSDETKHN
jgi:hypothetical protein